MIDGRRTALWRWIGLVAVTAGFVLIAVTWGEVAGTATVSRQVPQLVSGGLGSVALVAVGLAVIGAQARAQDGARMAEQLDQLDRTLAAIRRDLDGTT